MAEKAKILIIDDEEYICHLIKLILEKTNKFKVLISTTGQEGIELSKTNKPDLILLDILMPGMSGTAVAERLLEDTSTKDIPIVFLTGVVTKQDVEASKGMIGGRNFIAKPVTPEEVISAIRSVLQREFWDI